MIKKIRATADTDNASPRILLEETLLFVFVRVIWFLWAQTKNLTQMIIMRQK